MNLGSSFHSLNENRLPHMNISQGDEAGGAGAAFSFGDRHSVTGIRFYGLRWHLPCAEFVFFLETRIFHHVKSLPVGTIVGCHEGKISRRSVDRIGRRFAVGKAYFDHSDGFSEIVPNGGRELIALVLPTIMTCRMESPFSTGGVGRSSRRTFVRNGPSR